MDLLKMMWEEGWYGKTLSCFTVISILSIPFFIYASVQEDRRWESFKVEHKCRIVGRTSGVVGVGAGTVVTGSGCVGVGTVTTYESGKTGWLCDDGLTYWR